VVKAGFGHAFVMGSTVVGSACCCRRGRVCCFVAGMGLPAQCVSARCGRVSLWPLSGTAV